ncbi:MAG: HD domain-containing protein [Gammaproteobacteria bacterium]|nr:HD domain-containing protein [Gammaproteobacteria bacterium]MBU1732480.1 HD domain-containing protein [Gammaproteobacteria bacterium]MBU1891763.1 HD domain-containing protein [Gammaproteobacteria bacterium]
MPHFPWYNSIRFRVSLALFALFVLQAGTAGFTLYEVDLRKHDYEILNLAGQTRVISHTMAHESRNYLKESAILTLTSQRDSAFYARNLQQSMALYDKIISSFRNRRLDPEITGLAEPLTCSWDHNSRNQLDVSATAWENFRRGMQRAKDAAPSSPDIAAARYAAQHGEELARSSDKLSRAFQRMMEDKLATIRLFNQFALIASALLTALIAILVYRKMLRPLSLTVEGFTRVANGDLGYQVPLVVDNEIGRMTQTFNRLSDRMRALFRLTDRINRGTNLHDALKFVCEEFRTFLPVEWVGVLLITPDRSRVALERLYSESPSGLRENDLFEFALGAPEAALAKGNALAIDDLDAFSSDKSSAFLSARLAQDGKHSALFVPLKHGDASEAVLVFASSLKGAYTPEHVEFLTNLAAQIAHILEKTIVMEGLIVAAVEGLAKLAESRDPETGDHLVRMSLYSAILADELGKDDAHRECITPAYVRDVFRFAPMHDIGKVGIRDDILLKPGRLDPAERTEMERHPVIGGLVLRRSEEQMNALGHSIFQVGIEIAEGHHEKFDGSGYPAGLAGEAIPLSARIIAVADVLDALTSKRPYKEAWPMEKALETIHNDAGKHFDPAVVAALQRALPRVLEIYERLKHV